VGDSPAFAAAAGASARRAAILRFFRFSLSAVASLLRFSADLGEILNPGLFLLFTGLGYSTPPSGSASRPFRLGAGVA
jgi:hypothetical protein